MEQPSPIRLSARPRTEMVRVEGIDNNAHRRRPDVAAVERLASSMREIGLRTPITVRCIPNNDGAVERYILVAGGHRLAAAKRLGWKQIEWFESDAEDDGAELWEIDENLCRAELSCAEEAAAIAMRKEIYERLYPETKHGENQHTRSRHIGNSSSGADRFTADTAAKTGKTERTVQRLAKWGKEFGVDTLNKKIAGASLDKGVELDALVSMSPERRGPLIERAAAGEEVTARVRFTQQSRHIRRPGRRGWRARSPQRKRANIWNGFRDALDNLTGMPSASEVAAIIQSYDKHGSVETRLKKAMKCLEDLDYEYRQLRNHIAAAA